MKKQKMQAADERVVQESHRIGAKNLRMALLLLTALLLAKAAGMLAGLPWHALLPEAAGILCGGATCAVWMTLRGLWGAVDERVEAERAVCLSISWTLVHCAALLTATGLLFVDRENSMLYALTMLAMALVQYVTMGRMTKGGLYAESRPHSVWKRLLPVTAAVLLMGPAMLAVMGLIHQETYPAWVYAAVEGILLMSCLLGGLLAKALMKRSGQHAEEQLSAAERNEDEA